MSRGDMKISRGHCNGCGCMSQLERNGSVWGGGDLIMVLLSCGLWAGLKVLFNRVRNPWRCVTCGASISALSAPVAVLAGGGSLLAAILLFGTVGRACLGSDSRRGGSTIRPTPAVSSEPVARPPEDTAFDLIDMLPAEAGGMKLARAVAWKGRGNYHMPVKDQEAVGDYLWPEERTRQAQILSKDASVKCKRVPDSDDEPSCRDAMKVHIAGKPGCFFPEEGRNCVLTVKGMQLHAEGATVAWSGCELKYQCGHLGKRNKASILEVAEAIEGWASHARAGGPVSAEVLANRAKLLEAVANAREAQDIDDAREAQERKQERNQ